ncbi:MAG: hypothetical protein K2R98_19675 [Gemmataceae bacterium]|nr:hypothetical protein [Gemmataceae bacterium]
MSRTTLCVLTALVLAVTSGALMASRQQVMGDDVKVPTGPGTWKVTLLVTGKSLGDAKLSTATPLDFGRQHILREACQSEQMLDKPPDARHPERRQVLWTRRAGQQDGPFRALYEFYCTTSVNRPSAPMTELAQTLSAAPQPGQYLQRESVIESDHAAVADVARRLTVGLDRSEDQVEALYRYVEQEIANEPSVAGPAVSATDCLKRQGGDPSAKSRLLVALCRNRGVPARLVTGLTLARDSKQMAQHWVEVWLRDQWLPMSPYSHHYGWVPRTYLVFGYGDLPIVKGRNVRGLEYAFMVERVALEANEPEKSDSWGRSVFATLSFHSLPPTEQRLVEFLLLLPIAALIVCVFRNLIGLNSFGTFAPALLGLAFRELRSMPGFLVFTTIVLTGWLLRRLLDRYHLLQVPRMAVMLSLVVIVLITAIVTACHQNLPATKYVSLFPMVILVGMIERFWTLETEDGTSASFKTLFSTMFIAAAISVTLSFHAVVRHMFRFPETIGLIMAVQLLIGRYTGYRISELYRFRDFLRMQGPEFNVVHLD